MKEKTLHTIIQSLAENFASSLVGAVRAASIDDLLGTSVSRATHASDAPSSNGVSVSAASSGRNGRMRRRSLGDIDVLAGRIQTLLGSNKNGLRAEEIRLKLGIDRREIPRALAEGTRKRLFSKKGQKRATTYFSAQKSVKKSVKKKSAQKSVKKSAQKSAQKSVKKSVKKK